MFKKINLFTVLLLSIMGCLNQNTTEVLDLTQVLDDPQQKTSLTNSSGRIILGKRLEDPYTVEAMQEALDSLIANRNVYNQTQGLYKTVSEVPTIQANYLYIRFLPRGKRQADYIQRRDQDLVLHPQPLDYEILQDGDFYIDSTLPDSVVALYTVVPINYQFTDTVQHEILKEVFLIEQLLDQLAENLQGLAKTSNQNTLLNLLPNNTSLATTLLNLGVSLEQLEKTSLYLTNNLGDLFKSSTDQRTFLSKQQITSLSETNLDNVIAWGLPRKWRPRGTIKYMDDTLNEQPVVEVRITIGRWYGWQSRHTNEHGSFSGSRRYTRVKYQLHWDDNNFVLQDEGWELDGIVPTGHHTYRRGSYWSTYKSAWNVTLHGKEARFAVVYAAAEMYYYGDIDGLPRPRKDKWNTPRLDIELHNVNRKSHSLPGVYNLGENVTLYTKNNSGTLSHMNLYGLTIHELAHNAHWERSKHFNQIWDLTAYLLGPYDVLKLTESFAEGMEWWITPKRYPNYQMEQNSEDDREYTAIIQDLVDTNIRFGGFKIDSVRDSSESVNGYNILKLTQLLMKSTDWNDWKRKVLALNYLEALNQNVSGTLAHKLRILNDIVIPAYGITDPNANRWFGFVKDKLREDSIISTIGINAITKLMF